MAKQTLADRNSSLWNARKQERNTCLLKTYSTQDRVWIWVCSGVLRDLRLSFCVWSLERERERLSSVDNEMVREVFQIVVVTSKVKDRHL